MHQPNYVKQAVKTFTGGLEMKVKTNLKSGNFVTNAANQAKSLTTQTANLAENTWKAATNQASNLWATATSIF
jgi:hypothetical protein